VQDDVKHSANLALLAVLIGLSACAGAPKELPPRTPPPRQIPQVRFPSNALAPGQARVVLHTTDGPMRVEARADLEFVPPGGNAPSTRFGELCVTPCVVDLPPGKYKLYMTSANGSYEHGDVDVVDLQEGVNYYVRAPGKFEPPRWIHVLPTLVLLAGVTSFAVGAGFASSHDGGAQVAGVALMGAGVAVSIGGGFYLYDESRGSTQLGATTYWRERP
jgi:hypothetical protein